MTWSEIHIGSNEGPSSRAIWIASAGHTAGDVHAGVCTSPKWERREIPA